jgi:DNA replication and repair protein RecF
MKVTSLQLYNYRSYDYYELVDLAAATGIIIAGNNGVGKTNILEALSLASYTNGMRGAEPSLLQKQNCQDNWQIKLQLQDQIADEHTLQIYADHDGSKKRVYDNNPITIRLLSKELLFLYLTPIMDSLFCNNNSERRKLFDKYVNHYYGFHNKQLTQLENRLRERRKLIENQINNNAWFSIIEKDIATISIAITASRVDTINRINKFCATPIQSDFPAIKLTLTGFLEDKLSSLGNAVDSEAAYREYLEHNRANISIEGVHKSLLSGVFLAKNISCDFCSTGEQKLFIVSLLLGHLQALLQYNSHSKPILLLDEIISHLDEHYCQILIEYINSIGVQSWITTTNQNLSYANISNVMLS